MLDGDTWYHFCSVMLSFIEHPGFTKTIGEILTDEAYAEFQRHLAANPEEGDVIPGLGGLRKIRWAASGRGKRGGARIVYLFLINAGTVYLFHAYTKGDIADMTSEQKRRLKTAVESIKEEFSK